MVRGVSAECHRPVYARSNFSGNATFCPLVRGQDETPDRVALNYNLVMVRALLTISLVSSGITALPCTCVTAVNSTAKTMMGDDAVVFRGVVTERKTLPSRMEMKGRNRYVIAFRVDEYWKGSPGRTLVIYGLDSGTDCLGDGGYQVGKEYLVYAKEQRADDVVMGDYFWYGWKDILPEGSGMLVPDTSCKPGGELAKARGALKELGPGRVPTEGAKR